MKKTVLTLAVLTAVTAFAQKIILPPRPLPLPLVHVADLRADEKPVMITAEAKIAADNGFFRRVETTITFTNPNARVFAGELEFPIPDGATVCGYELEVNGSMVPGVVVPKEQARVAFENETKKGVDPGLVEHVKGNVWKTRIFPLAPNAPRKAMVAYIVENGTDGANKTDGTVTEKFGDEIFVAGVQKIVENLTLADRLRRAKRAVVYWDASMSRRGKYAADRNLLECLPEKGDFALVVFRNVIEQPLKFETRADLLKSIGALVYDGGTCLDKVLDAQRSTLNTQHSTFIFSDEYQEPKPRKVLVEKLEPGKKPPVEPKEGSLLATAWAMYFVDAHSEVAESHTEELVEIGRKYGVASSVTSLIVLESLEQYKSYKIEPPKSMSFYDEWKKWRAAEDDPIAAEKAKADHRTQLLGYWEERVKWWKDPIPPKATPKSGVFAGSASRSANAAIPMMSADVPTVAPVPAESVRTVRSAVRMRSMAGARSAGAAAPAMEAKSAGDAGSGVAPTVKLTAWDPKTPYLDAIKKAEKSGAYAEYLKQREVYGTSPAFYLDCAGWFFTAGETKLGVRIISNLTEMKLEDAALWRTMGWRLRQAGLYDEAVAAFRHVLKMRGEEAQSRRDLALVLTEKAKSDFQNSSFVTFRSSLEEALALLHDAAFTPRERRSGRRGNDIQTSVFALEELNGLLAWCEANKDRVGEVKTPEIDAAFRRDLPLKLRIVMSWDADATDIDLHVLEPDGEEAYYGYRRTSSGGFVSEDVTTGYGPEEYLRKGLNAGVYKVMSNYFASHQTALTGAATVSATVYTDWATKDERMQVLTLRLDKPKDKNLIGEIDLDN
jgi:hypothetical protein